LGQLPPPLPPRRRPLPPSPPPLPPPLSVSTSRSDAVCAQTNESEPARAVSPAPYVFVPSMFRLYVSIAAVRDDVGAGADGQGMRVGVALNERERITAPGDDAAGADVLAAPLHAVRVTCGDAQLVVRARQGRAASRVVRDLAAALQVGLAVRIPGRRARDARAAGDRALKRDVIPAQDLTPFLVRV
jgi:hypothetical protein